MKKTISINIKGLNFVIEEDAYELLHAYMNRLQLNLKGQKGANDIVEDIELRIAELCQQILSSKKQVVEKEDIESIIKTLGEPEDFIDDDNEKNENKNFTAEQHSSLNQKHLYRDIDNAKIAGICAGLSNYFHVDPLVIRIVFLLFFLVGGFGFPLYIILWIVIPKTSSTIDRLKMQGKPITVDTVKEEIEQAAQRINSSSKSFADRLRKEKDYSKRFSRLGKIITSIIGFGLIGIGIFCLIIFIILFFGGLYFIPVISETSYLSINQIAELILSDSNDIFYAWFGIFLSVFSAVIFFISNGTFILLNIKSKWTKISSLSLIGFGIIGTLICIYVGMKTGRNLAVDAEIEKEMFAVNLPELKIETLKTKRSDLNGFEEKNAFNESFDNALILSENKLKTHGVNLIYRKSKDSLYHVLQNFRANSYSNEKAIKKAKNIRNNIQLNHDVLLISPAFEFPKSDKIRLQKVTIIIEIPNNKWVNTSEEKISLDFNSLENKEKYGYINRDGIQEHWN